MGLTIFQQSHVDQSSLHGLAAHISETLSWYLPRCSAQHDTCVKLE